ANARAGGKLVLQSQHRVALVLREDLQTTDRNLPDPSAEPSTTHDGDRLAERVNADATGEKQVDRLRRAGGENAGILEEERPLHREEQWKARQVRTLFVDLDLREVGVVREVERQTRRDAVLELAADVATLARFGIDGKVAFHARERVRRHGQHSPRGYLDPLQRAGMRDLHEAELPRHEGPERLFILAADAAHEVESPRLHVPRPVAQCRERNPELGVPPGGVGRRRDGPRAVPVEVEAPKGARHSPRLARQLDATAFSFIHNLCVVLDGRRRGGEHEAVLPVVVGIEEDAEVVALRDVAVAHLFAGDNAVMLRVVEPGADVEGLTVGDDTHFSSFGDRLTFMQLALHEAGDWLDRLPDGFSQTPIDGRRRGDDVRARDGIRVTGDRKSVV